MRRSRLAVLAAVAVLFAGAVVLGQRDAQVSGVTTSQGANGAGGTSAAELAALRTAAALEACPTGLGPELPDLVLACLGGGPDVELRATAPGRPTLVNVWGSWCAPCAEEMPDLVAFHERAGDRVGLVGVLTTDTLERGLAFSRDFGKTWPSLVDDDGEVLRAFLPGPPVTLFLDAKGRVVHRQAGAFTDLAQLEALVAEHLGVTV